MTQKEKQIKLAEAMGARWHWVSDNSAIFITFKEWDGEFVKPGETHKKMFLGNDIPDYFGSLDACHQLENKLIVGIAPWGQYYNNVYYDTLFELKVICEDKDVYRAKAEHRAEAIGRTLRLW